MQEDFLPVVMHSTHFDNIEYLKHGNDRQRAAWAVLSENLIMSKLHSFDPILTGTIPIDIDIEGSDLDIICCWSDKQFFIDSLTRLFEDENGFRIRETCLHGNESVVANFTAGSFEVEVFGQNIPVKEQFAYRHMIVEHKLLSERGETFRQQIRELKRQGCKTEPAFGILLGLKGNPYTALLSFEA